MPFVAALELSLGAQYCQVYSEHFSLFAKVTTPKWNGDLRKGFIAIWIPNWMLNGTISRPEINGSFPSPCLSWAADPCYMVYLQCLSPFLSECSQAVPLVTYLLTSIIDTCSIMVVQFTKKEQRQKSVWLFERQELLHCPHFHWPSAILPLFFAIFLLR